MKETILDMADKFIRVIFYVGVGMYIASKGVMYFAQFEGIMRLLVFPTFFTCVVAMAIITTNILLEPSPSERRAAQEKAKKLEALLKYYKDGYK